MDLNGKTVIVTGGASGLGGACTEVFAKAGANVMIADLNEEAGRSMQERVGDRAMFVTTNVADESSVQAMVDRTLDHFKGIDGLINCAGIGIPEKLLNKEGEPHRLKTFSKVIEVNLIGTFNVIRLVIAAMNKVRAPEAVERGVIINTASVAAFEGQIGQLSYAASKGGILAMTLPLARELAPMGVRVMTVAPGTFDTPMLAGLPDKVKVALGQQVPFPPRLGDPKEFATLAQHIFENEMLNGEVIRLDGALRMAAR